MNWHSAPCRFDLGADEVHIWRADLDAYKSLLQPFHALLSHSEAERARRFRFDVHRHWLIIRRGLLRTLLGRYLGADPRAIQFIHNPQGKPDLADEDGPDALRFNLSDSHGMALFAFVRGRRVGIDIEKVRPDPDIEGLADRFFAPREVRDLMALPLENRREAFFRCWACKEAYIKAIGEGLSLGLDTFEVELRPDEPARLVRSQRAPDEHEHWRMYDLPATREYHASLIVEQPAVTIRCWDWHYNV